MLLYFQFSDVPIWYRFDSSFIGTCEIQISPTGSINITLYIYLVSRVPHPPETASFTLGVFCAFYFRISFVSGGGMWRALIPRAKSRCLGPWRRCRPAYRQMPHRKRGNLRTVQRVTLPRAGVTQRGGGGLGSDFTSRERAAAV